MNAEEEAPPSIPNQTIKIEDLPVEDGKDADIKGGPIFIKVDGVKGNVTPRGP